MHTLALIAVIVPITIVVVALIAELALWIYDDPETAITIIVCVLLFASLIWGLIYLKSESEATPPTAESTK